MAALEKRYGEFDKKDDKTIQKQKYSQMRRFISPCKKETSIKITNPILLVIIFKAVLIPSNNNKNEEVIIRLLYANKKIASKIEQP
ncbi:MAG: hypothetical protein LBB59_00560 [Campylobacteraceae bacterium]|nr:hypothetical protein [Campylobacteraceae bacterium]